MTHFLKVAAALVMLLSLFTEQTHSLDWREEFAVDGVLLRFSEKKIRGSEASQQCKSQGGEQLVIQDEKMLDKIRNLKVTADYSHNEYFIGNNITLSGKKIILGDGSTLDVKNYDNGPDCVVLGLATRTDIAALKCDQSLFGFICSFNTCQVPDPIPHGRVQKPNQHYTDGQVISVECDRGYVPVDGVTTATCAKNLFEPKSLGCRSKNSCPTLPAVSDGNLQKPAPSPYYPHGTALSFACPAGEVANRPESVCSRGSWEPAVMACRSPKACGKLPLIVGSGSYASPPATSSIADGATFRVMCAAGHSLTSQSNITRCSDGRFDVAHFECVADFCDVSNLTFSNGKRKMSSTASSSASRVANGGSVEIECDSEMEAWKNVTSSTCLKGSFAPRTLLCVRKKTTSACKEAADASAVALGGVDVKMVIVIVLLVICILVFAFLLYKFLEVDGRVKKLKKTKRNQITAHGDGLHPRTLYLN